MYLFIFIYLKKKVFYLLGTERQQIPAPDSYIMMFD